MRSRTGACVYEIVHQETGSRYVGITTGRPSRRWAQHKSTAKHRPATKLHLALRKYGPDAFDFRVIAGFPTLALARLAEVSLIKFNHPEYNVTAGGDGAFGHRWSAEDRARMSEQRRGNQNAKGYRHTEATRAILSAVWLGRKQTPEHTEKVAAQHRGRKRSPEARARMCAAQQLRWSKAK
jgi:group I intron endonuclease